MADSVYLNKPRCYIRVVHNICLICIDPNLAVRWQIVKVIGEAWHDRYVHVVDQRVEHVIGNTRHTTVLCRLVPDIDGVWATHDPRWHCDVA